MKKMIGANFDVMLRPIKRVTRVEIISAVKKTKLGRAAGSSEVNTEIKVASGKWEGSYGEIVPACSRWKRIPYEWKPNL